jgi:RNA polymerase sigma-70 factor, ECF subfamily
VGSPPDITSLLRAWGSGDEAALTRLMPLVYDQMHRLARQHMARERTGHPLQSTGLVHEVYLRLVEVTGVEWQNRGHFYGLCARLMRRILVDAARSRNYKKREGQFAHIPIEEAGELESTEGSQVLVIDEALRKLAKLDERKAAVVELRFFGGLSVEETGVALQVSPETIMREWKLAKAWLLRELQDGDSG